MRWSKSLILLAVSFLLIAAPASAAGELEMNCPRCDHVDVAGHGLRANATLTLVVRDVRSGQEVVPETSIRTDGSGGFDGEYPVDLTKHPALIGSVYDKVGDDLELAAHTRAQAPAHCARAANLPYSGAPSAPTAILATALLTTGSLLLLTTRHRPRPASR
jgi:hypothetical protein